MQVIGARPRDCRDRPAGGPPKFRRGHVGVDFKFLDAVYSEVGSGRPSGGAVGMIVNIGTIQQEAVGVRAASVDVESRPRTKVKRSAALPRANSNDPWLQESEVVPTPAVQRQVPNGSCVH